MLVPLSWLKDYVDINISADELEKKLFDCGFEVEEKWQVGKDISGIVVGYVDSCEPIPETHLHVCQVNVGGPELLQICCGADNVKAGGKFPVAMIGAKVYATAKDHVTIEGVATIKKGKLRGYESQGMLCSGHLAFVIVDAIFSRFLTIPSKSISRSISSEVIAATFSTSKL